MTPDLHIQPILKRLIILFLILGVSFICFAEKNASNESSLTAIQEKIKAQEDNENFNDLVNNYDELANYYAKQNNFEGEFKAKKQKAIFLEKTGQKEEALTLLINLGEKASNEGFYILAVESHDAAIEIQKKLNPNEQTAKLYFDFGTLYSNKEKYDLALKYFEKSMEAYKNLELNNEYINTCILTAETFDLVGMRPLALDIYNEARLIAQEIKNQSAVVRCNDGIGKIYLLLKAQQKALKYFQEAQEISNVNNFKDQEATSFNNLAATYIQQEDLLKAEEMAILASNILKETENKDGLIDNYNLIADIAAQANNYEKAAAYYTDSYNLAKEEQNTDQIIENLNDKGFLAIKLSKYTNAIESCKAGYDLAKENELKSLLYKSCECLAAAYKADGNNDKSYEYFEEFNGLERELFSTEKAKEIGKIEGKYEYKLFSKDSEHKIEELEKENKLQKIWATFFTLIAILFVLIAINFYRQNKIKQRNHETLLGLHKELKVSNTNYGKLNTRLIDANKRKQLLNERLLNTNTELEELNKVYNRVNQMLQKSNEKLEHANSSLSNFASIAAHDLKAPLRSISSFSNLLVRKNKSKFDDTDKEYFEFITDNTIRMQKMIDSLLVFSKIDKNLPEPQIIELEKIVKDTCATLNSTIEETNAVIECEPLPTIKAHAPLLGQLIQNILNNAIKFRKPGVAPYIIIKSKRSIYDGLHHILIKDNGIGIEKENADKAFELFTRFNKTSEYEGSGIGLSTCKKIVAFYGGEIWMESTFGEGTTVHFTLKA